MPAAGGLGNAGAVANAPHYKQGDKSNDVILLQTLLNTWGFSPGKLDGNFGPGVANAVKSFQQYVGLNPTGEADGNTIQYLQSQSLLNGVKQGLIVPGQPLPDHMVLDGLPTLNADKVKSISPPVPETVTPPDRPIAAPPATGGAGGGGGGVNLPPAPPKPKTQKEIEDQVRAKYGSYAWMLDDPNFAEVRKVLMDGADKGWDDQALGAQLANTNYFKTHDANVRKYETRQHTDGPTLNSDILKNQGKISTMAQKMGVDLDPATILTMAQNSVKFNWLNESDFTSAVAAEAQYKPDYSGDIGGYETKAKNIARDYLQPIDDEAAFRYAKDMAAGKIDENTITSNFKKTAKGLLGPDYDAQIDAGIPPRVLMGGQINTVANLMEIDPNNVDLVNDSRFQSVLQLVDDKGKRRPMTVAEVSRHVKGLDDWWKTDNANKEVANKADYIGKVMGRTV